MNRHRLLNLIDRERTQLERIGRHAAERIGLQARIQAIRAVKVGADPVYAVRQALWGAPRLGLQGIVKLLTDAMTAAHLQGRRRSLLIAAPQMRAKDGWRLAGSAYDQALAFLQKRLNLTAYDIASIEQRYAAEVLHTTRTLSNQLERAVQETVLRTTQEGMGVREGVRELRKVFDTQGFIPSNNYSLEAIFRTQTNTAYAAGRWNANEDPAIQEILFGYEFSAILDDRTTEICAPLDGMKLAKDHPAWDRLTPLLHWSCRSTLLELWVGDANAFETAIPDVQPQPGFGFNPGKIFSDGLRPAA